jgi:hypothetical protein
MLLRADLLLAMTVLTSGYSVWVFTKRLSLSPTATIFDPSCSTEGANRWRLLAEWDVAPADELRKLISGGLGRHRPAQLHGSVRKGWWKRMNAGESPLNQGRSVKAAPVRFQKAVPRSKENAAVERREARRHALWAGNPVSQTGLVRP